MIRSVTQLCNDRAITSWQQHLRAIGRSEGTIEQYSSYVVRFLRGRSAYAATLDDIEGGWPGYRWAPATRRSAASSLASFYRWALRHGQRRIRPDRGPGTGQVDATLPGNQHQTTSSPAPWPPPTDPTTGSSWPR